MKKMFRNAVIALGLGATALTAAASAQARDVRYRGHDDAGVAVAAGLAGLAVGAAIASSGDRYRDDGYYYETYDYPGYYARPAYYGYYGYPRSYSYAYAYPRGGYRYYDHRYYNRGHNGGGYYHGGGSYHGRGGNGGHGHRGR